MQSESDGENNITGKIKQEPNKGSTLANSKFLKSSKPGKNLGMPNDSDDDSDSDDDRIKRIKYDPNDPLRNERRYNPNPFMINDLLYHLCL